MPTTRAYLCGQYVRERVRDMDDRGVVINNEIEDAVAVRRVHTAASGTLAGTSRCFALLEACFQIDI